MLNLVSWMGLVGEWCTVRGHLHAADPGSNERHGSHLCNPFVPLVPFFQRLMIISNQFNILEKILDHYSWASFTSCFIIWCVHASLFFLSFLNALFLHGLIENSVLRVIPRLPAQQRLCPSWHQARELSAPKQRSRCDLAPVESAQQPLSELGSKWKLKRLTRNPSVIPSLCFRGLMFWAKTVLQPGYISLWRY